MIWEDQKGRGGKKRVERNVWPNYSILYCAREKNIIKRYCVIFIQFITNAMHILLLLSIPMKWTAMSIQLLSYRRKQITIKHLCITDTNKMTRATNEITQLFEIQN